VSFRFNKRRYFIILDETAEDDLDYLNELVAKESNGSEGSFIANPGETFITYGLPFEGKTLYLYLAQADKRRLDVVLAEKDPTISRSTWQKHLKAGHVEVKGKAITCPKYEVIPGESITLNLPEDSDFSDLALPI